MVALLRESGDLDGEPKPTTRMTNFYEKGDKPLEIVATRQWYIRNGGRDAALRDELLERRRRDPAGCPAHMKQPLRQLGRRPQRRLADLAAALLRHPVPGLVPARRRRRARLRAPAAARARTSCRSTRRPTAPHGYTEDQRGKPDGFLGDPDVMDTWATSSLTPQIAGGWESDPDLFAAGLPDGPVHPGPRHHPHLAVLAGGPRALREPRRRPVVARDAVRLDPRPGPQEDVEVQGQRRRARPRSSTKYGADAVRWRAAMARPGTGLAVRRDPDEGRPPAGDEGAQRLEVRPRRRRRDRAQRLRGLRAGRLRAARPAGRR